ncbi:hypothetical protein BK004_02910 [bacterium CG10_46_32]|nr:MAG: hypothetical protein BK004_02910 [bacterium CG10_46_32]PIR56051.1 MAG: transposase [Parcubacteria group bacterium CG10_big_fil_rev_8_21_14_0_10_46_32]
MPTPRINKAENENKAHFITITVIEWIDIFTKPEYFKIVLDSFAYCRANKGLLLHEYVVMTNHLHFIGQAKEGFALSRILSDFKKYTTHEITKLLEKDNRRYILSLLKNSFSRKAGYTFQIWRRENYPEMILSNEFLEQKIKYIYDNPVKRGFVEKAEDWMYSSARNRILEDTSLIELDSIA